MNPKFIIQDGELRLGRVDSHWQLKDRDGSKPVGGGWWFYDIKNNICYLYSKSIEYGQVTLKDLEDIWVRPSMVKAIIYFSTEENLEFAMKNNVSIQHSKNETSS